jgi:hypothetical protein
MDGMDQSLIPFVVLAPPVPMKPHVAPAHPTEADLEVRSPYPPFPQSVNLTNRRSDAIGQKRSLTTNLTRRQACDTGESESCLPSPVTLQRSTKPSLIGVSDWSIELTDSESQVTMLRTSYG